MSRGANLVQSPKFPAKYAGNSGLSRVADSPPQQIGVGPPGLRIVRVGMRQVKRQRAAGAGAVAETEEEIAQGAGAERKLRVALHVQSAFLLQVVRHPPLV